MSRLPGTAEGTKWKLVAEGEHSDDNIYQEIAVDDAAASDHADPAPPSAAALMEQAAIQESEEIRRRHNFMPGSLEDWMQTVCFSHALALDPFSWEWPDGEFEAMGLANRGYDGKYRAEKPSLLFAEIKKRSDWFRENKPELLPAYPYRWSGHPGLHYKLYNGSEEERSQIMLQMERNVQRTSVRENYRKDGSFAGRTNREPKHTWTKQHGKANEQELHANIHGAFLRADCVVSLVTVVPVVPFVVDDPEFNWEGYHHLHAPPKSKKNPNFGTLAEEWLKVPLYLYHIYRALENLPGCIRVGVVVEAHPSHGYGKKKKGAAAPAPGEFGGREERYADEIVAGDAVREGNDANSFPAARPPRSSRQKKMAAARKKAKRDAEEEVISDPRFSDKDPNAIKNLQDEVIRLKAQLRAGELVQAHRVPPQPAPPPKKAPAAAAIPKTPPPQQN